MSADMNLTEMMNYYHVNKVPIESCPIFTSLHGVLCGNCPLLPHCNHGKRHIKQNYRLRHR